jgi:hypothetical protein
MRFLVVILLFLSACNSAVQTVPTTRRSLPTTELPPMKVFGGAGAPRGVTRSNIDIARDFLDLSFELESGKSLERFTRFEGPVKISLSANAPAAMRQDLDQLIKRLKTEAKIDIQRVNDPAQSNIVVSLIPRASLQRAVPHAACFVVPRVSSWEQFKKGRGSGKLDWTTLERRDLVSIFIPNDVSPQEHRDCLHEEIAQALGPVNDIYRLADSVFNDDNIHTILTSFDMLILRAYYSRSLHNGMSKAQVATQLPALLNSLNPQGAKIAPKQLGPAPRSWVSAIESALGPRSGDARRVSSARKALKIAQQNGWYDNRLGFSLFALGRLSLSTDARLAVESFAQSYTVYSRLYGRDDIHTAHVGMQLAAFAISAGEPERAVALVNDSLQSVLRAQNATLLATLLMIKSQALEMSGQRVAAQAVRLDSLGWARYGFGSDQEVRQRLDEIASLAPPTKKAESS